MNNFAEIYGEHLDTSVVDLDRLVPAGGAKCDPAIYHQQGDTIGTLVEQLSEAISVGNEPLQENILTRLLDMIHVAWGLSNAWSGDSEKTFSELGLDIAKLDLAPVLSSLKNHYGVDVDSQLVEKLCTLTGQAFDKLASGQGHHASL